MYRREGAFSPGTSHPSCKTIASPLAAKPKDVMAKIVDSKSAYISWQFRAGSYEPIEWKVYYTALDFSAIDGGEHSVTVPAPSHSLHICGLQPGVNYVFEVASVVQINSSTVIVNRARATVIKDEEPESSGKYILVKGTFAWGEGLYGVYQVLALVTMVFLGI